MAIKQRGRTGSNAKKTTTGVSTGGPKKPFAKHQDRKSSQKFTVVGKASRNPIISILVLPFHESVFTAEVLVPFLNGLVPQKESETDLDCGLRIVNGYVSKQKIQLIVPNLRENINVILDAAKVADVLLCVFPSEATYQDSCFDALGYRTLTALRLQGLPALTVGSVIDPSASKAGIKTVQRYFVSEFTDDKKCKFVVPSATLRSGNQRQLASQVVNTIKAAFSGSLGINAENKCPRGYLLIDQLRVEGSEVTIRGFTRGAGFGLTTGVVLTGCPEIFRVKRIEILDQSSEMEEIVQVIEPSELEIAETLKNLQPLLPAELQEQTWPTLEEEMEAEAENPHLFPEQAEHNDINDNEQEKDEEETEEDNIMSSMFDWDKLTENAETKKFEMRTRDEMDFVDEVDTPENVAARVRFQKYRGLKSLRSGDWDPYEELPVEYSQIHEFQDSAWAAKQCIIALQDAGKICKHKYAKIYLETVSGNTVQGNGDFVAASTVAPFECKMTVVHCRVSRNDLTAEIKNKDQIIVQCGFRRLAVSPIYSEIPKQASSLLQRMHRTLHTDTGANVMMSFFAPAMFGYTPVLAFSPQDHNLLLWGSVSSCAPNKPIILKRSTLTGYPFRVHQTKAVCRFMFFFPEDIDWFKPVELTTKKGLRGHIIESLGTHGYMKCRFNGQLTSDDVILLHLYKRVFPKSL